MPSPSDPIKRSPNSSTPLQNIPFAQPADYQYPQQTSMSGGFADQYGADAMGADGFDPALFPPQFQSVSAMSYPAQNGAAMSNQLVRRPTNNQLTSTRNPSAGQQQWLSPTQQVGAGWDDMDPADDLNARAAVAKQEAQAKRKQIPPFVLKLWSFLNEDKNTELIRWTDDGTAFTVLDEDEFARTLIPELFKHNNYASFVRQLNMYGFHKKVGLNANSMKAAEKKTKDPNVYWHEYFRQGREDLLWLIQKPQSKSSAAKRKRGQDHKEGESDDDRRASPDVDGAHLTKVQKSDPDMTVVPKSEVTNLRQEVQKLQRQQGIISKMISQLKEQNEQFYRQASEFQSQHDRHENSINAILTFLATFYNRSLEAGVDLSNMFGNQGTPQHQGTVVDMGDNEYQDSTSNQQLQRYRKPQLLLQSSPIPPHARPAGRVSTQPPSSRNSESPPNGGAQKKRPTRSDAVPQSNSNTASPVVRDDAGTPNMDSGDMMSLINATNANTPSTSSPQYDFTSALNHAQNANGQGPLTAQQRTNMLNLIAQQQASGQGGANSALLSPNPPPVPDLAQYQRTQEQLEQLARLQREQDSKVQDLAGRIQPLSPNGSIPGLDVYGSQTPPADFDFDAFLNNPYQSGGEGEGQGDGTGAGGDDDPTGLNFNFDPDGGTDDLFGDMPPMDGGAGKVESVHSESDGQHTGGKGR